MTEIWKDIKGYEGFYQVSNLGNIRSLDRVYLQKSSHNTNMYKKYKGKIICPTDNGNGYLIVTLRENNNKKKNYYVHRLVAEAFVENQNNFTVVNHIDYNKQNNAADNLEWVTTCQNVQHSLKNMEKERKHSKPTTTGEKYITIKNNKWRLNIQRKNIKCDKLFDSFDEAKKAKEVMLCG